MYQQAAGMILGEGMKIGGAFMGANAANKRRNQLLGIAETPGIDATKVARESIDGLQQNLPFAEQLASDVNEFNQEQLDAALAKIIPGYSGMQTQRAANSAALLRGELPPDVVSGVNRAAAAKGVAGGYSGSKFGANLVLRDLGLTTLDAQRAGADMFQTQISGTPRAPLVNPLDLSGLKAPELIKMKSAERYDKMDRLTTWAGAATGREVWSKYLTDSGSELQGMASGGGMDGMFGGKN